MVQTICRTPCWQNSNQLELELNSIDFLSNSPSPHSLSLPPCHPDQSPRAFMPVWPLPAGCSSLSSPIKLKLSIRERTALGLAVVASPHRLVPSPPLGSASACEYRPDSHISRVHPLHAMSRTPAAFLDDRASPATTDRRGPSYAFPLPRRHHGLTSRAPPLL